MDTKELISTLKTPTHEPRVVTLRQALIHILYTGGVPVTIIAKLLKCSRVMVYNHIYRVRDLKEINDKIIINALDELSSHAISVRPCTLDGDVYNRVLGYRLIIDNIIY